MVKLQLFINSISNHNDKYYYHGDGTGDFEAIADQVDDKLLLDYKDYLNEQLHYLENINEKI